MWKKIKPYVISVAIALGVGGLSAFFTRNNMTVYENINQPPLAPPMILFPIVWSILFILMGIGSAIVYQKQGENRAESTSALWIYGMQLVVNFFWSIIFFNMRAFLLAFLWLLLLLFLIIRTIMKYYSINKTAALLQIPYLLWVTFAGYLTFAIWYLNK